MREKNKNEKLWTTSERERAEERMLLSPSPAVARGPCYVGPPQECISCSPENVNTDTTSANTD